MTFQKGAKFRIYPNWEQRNLIDRTLGCSRLIYNRGLAMREDAFKSGEKCGYKQTSAMLTALKQDVNYAFLKEVDSIALQQAQWKCPSCHTVHDRDKNAAINILHKGLKKSA